MTEGHCRAVRRPWPLTLVLTRTSVVKTTKKITHGAVIPSSGDVRGGKFHRVDAGDVGANRSRRSRGSREAVGGEGVRKVRAARQEENAQGKRQNISKEDKRKATTTL